MSRRLRVYKAIGVVAVFSLLILYVSQVWLPERDRNELFQAAGEGNAPRVKMLVDAGIAVDTRNRLGETALMEAAKNNRTGVAKLLISRGANINAQDDYGDTALVHAVHNTSADMVEMLLLRGADIKLIDETGNVTILHWAAMNEPSQPDPALKIVNLLLQHGADPNAIDFNGNTPRDCAKSPTVRRALIAEMHKAAK